VPDSHSMAYSTDMLDSLLLIHQGKVRDSFALDEDHMLIVASDRLSAFDVVLPDPVPGKGALLTQISNFWFEKTRDIIDNHLTGVSVGDVFADPNLIALLEDRAVIVRRLQPLPVEAIVRGYLIGSGWKPAQSAASNCLQVCNRRINYRRCCSRLQPRLPLVTMMKTLLLKPSSN